MKTNIITYTIVFCLAGILLNSCSSDFLEVVPKGKLVAETVADYDQALYNLNLINIGTDAQFLLGDEVAAVEPYFSAATLRTQRLFRYESMIYEADENAVETQIPMENIYIFNKIINEIDDATEGTEQQKLSIKAEALAGRAWTYFQLINYYGLPYNEETSGTDLGYPIVTEADLTQTLFRRATVKEVYDFMVDDLTTALPNLPLPVESRVRMSKAGAEGLLGKIYVFMGKFDEALPLLNATLEDMQQLSVPVGLENIAEIIDNDGYYDSPFLPDDIEHIYAKQSVDGWAGDFDEDIVVSPEAVALYQPEDIRLNFYVDFNSGEEPYPVEGVLRRITNFNSRIGVVVSDIYLLNAEVKCRLNDLAGAVDILETFRKSRLPEEAVAVPAAIASNQIDLLKFIFEERIREFAVLGYRWFDMRRLTVDPLIPTPASGFSHALYDEDGNVKEEFTLSQERLVLRFPQKLMDQNPGFENNK